MNIKELNSLIYSPEWTSELIRYSLSGAIDSNEKGLKFELLYVLIPILYDDYLISVLRRLNSKSSINSFKNLVDNKSKIFNKSLVNDHFREISNKSLIYISNKEKIYIGNFIKIEHTHHYSNIKNNYKKQYFKAAYNLGYILGKEDYRNVFLKLGVTNI